MFPILHETPECDGHPWSDGFLRGGNLVLVRFLRRATHDIDAAVASRKVQRLARHTFLRPEAQDPLAAKRDADNGSSTGEFTLVVRVCADAVRAVAMPVEQRAVEAAVPEPRGPVRHRL